jgi:hypothetical protein
MHHFREAIRTVFHLDHKMYFQEEAIVQMDIESENHLVHSDLVFHHRLLLLAAVVRSLQQKE